MIHARLLAVVAHPDDETFGCGSLLLHAAARGVETSVCCATRGEAGEPAPDSGVSVEQLPAVREGELRDAAAFMGVKQLELLGFVDSGMSGEPPENSVVRVALGELAGAIGEVVERIRPHIVVALDASDGHRDHARVRDATLVAVGRASWSVRRVYLECLPRSLMRRWAQHQRDAESDSPYLDVDEAGLGTPDAAVTTLIDVSEHLEDRRVAMALHASQVSPYAGLPEPLEHAFLAMEHLQRVVPPPVEGELETDLLAGIEDRPEPAGSAT